MSKTVIKFENVSKEYFLYKSGRERFKAIFNNNKNVKKHKVIDDISFEIKEGESVGIIGRNGAGKSTLLKMIKGVSFPTSGNISVKGKVAALLELTAGFSADMTGRENIYLKCYLLGLEKSEIAEIEQNIIEFAALGEYIDQPVRTYSSGMKMRLGFSININIRPDILVIDEALSVGDAEFRKKCEGKIKELRNSGITVLFVSHSMASMNETCSRAIYLNGGKIAFDGDVKEAFEKYNAKKK